MKKHYILTPLLLFSLLSISHVSHAQVGQVLAQAVAQTGATLLVEGTRKAQNGVIKFIENLPDKIENGIVRNKEPRQEKRKIKREERKNRRALRKQSKKEKITNDDVIDNDDKTKEIKLTDYK